MESNLHNLVPAIGEIYEDYSNFKFGLIDMKREFTGNVMLKLTLKRRYLNQLQIKLTTFPIDNYVAFMVSFIEL